MNLTRLKEQVLTSPPLLRVYAGGLRTASHVLASVGRPRAALATLLQAMRASSGAAGRPRDVERLRELLEGVAYHDGRLLPIARNRLLAEYAASTAAREIRDEFQRMPRSDRVRLRFPTPPGEADDPERLGDLMVLKGPCRRTGEKGVLQVAYTESIDRFLALYDVAGLSRYYRIVLEPSWWGYQALTFMRLLGEDLDVFVESPSEPDERFLLTLDSNLRPIELGFGDWVEPSLFRPSEDGEPDFDLVMVSSWNPVKRHDELFETLARLHEERSLTLRVALVGYPAGWQRSDIEKLARRYGVLQMCTIFEALSPSEVADVVSKSRAFLLLSRREGGNRAIYEALFCDTPILVYRHHRGVNLRHVNGSTGLTFQDGELAETIHRMMSDPPPLRPREWALENTGWENSSRLLNDRVRAVAIEAGEPWSRDLAPRRNLPNLRYAREGDYRDFADAYEDLFSFLRE